MTVDAQTADGTPELDELQRVGAIALLEQGFEAVDGIEGPDGMEATVVDTLVGAHPGGALLKVFAHSPTLEIAEAAVRALVEELLERTELLAEWTVEKCEVELHPDLAQESLDAAAGPGAPPDDPAARRAHLAKAAHTPAPSETETETAADSAKIRRQMFSLASQLRAFGPQMFGVVTEEAQGGEEFGGYAGTSHEDAQLAAGALLWAANVMIDQLFMDVHTLTEADTNVAECTDVLWHLEDLPRRYALRYDAKFARRFLVTVTAMTTRFTHGTFTQLGCIAEELALRILLTEAKVCLETFGLLDDGVEQALDCFADLVYEDMDHEWLYDDAADGIGDSPAGELLRITPMGLADWFSPFSEERCVHPYARETPPGDSVAGASS
ncbi:hypothetical protein [Streptomyces fractus]|uniref:hypothetical protein n=1 Tax=Streptomyces fractus TaxID=641806 RepID=UPI003CF98C1A